MRQTRVYTGRLAGMMVLGPDGDFIGRVRDVIVTVNANKNHVAGLLLELASKQQIFLPMLRVATITSHEVTTISNTVSFKEFTSRPGEIRIMDNLIGEKVHTNSTQHPELIGRPLEIVDVEIAQRRTRDWEMNDIAVCQRSRFGRRTDLTTLNIREVDGITSSGVGPADQDQELMAQFSTMRAVDVAQAIQHLPLERQTRLATAMDDEMLADVLEELPEDDQATILQKLNIERAADILEEMNPDDAADLLGELTEDKAEVLLGLMEPEDSESVRRLMDFEPDTVGAIMTPEPIILLPQATVAEALAHARNEDRPPALASMVFVVRPPTATPTGKFLGCVHTQKLLREPPSMLIGGILDPDLPPLFASDSKETAARYFATYNLVCAPVVDENQHLLGAVDVDDLLDHLLPGDWREQDMRANQNTQATTTSTATEEA